jgi:cytochrome c
VGGGEEGRYFLTASYTDKGGASVPLTTKKTLVLRPSKVQAEEADQLYLLQKSEQGINGLQHRSWFLLRDVDLKDVHAISFRYASASRGATIQVRADSLKGALISSVDYAATGARDKFNEVTAPVNDPGGKRHLYFLIIKPDTPNTRLGSIDWIRFEGGREVAPEKKPAPKLVKAAKASASPITQKSSSNSSSVSGRALIQKSDCLTCHKVSGRIIGPSYTEIARKYTTSTAVVNRLVDKVIRGGSGSWGSVPMTPHPKMSRKDAAVMVQYILSLD